MSSQRMNQQVNQMRQAANAFNAASRRTNITNAERRMYQNTARQLRATIDHIIGRFLHQRSRRRSGRSHARTAALSKVLHRSGPRK